MNDNADETTPELLKTIADLIESSAKEADKVSTVIGNMYGKKGLTPPSFHARMALGVRHVCGGF